MATLPHYVYKEEVRDGVAHYFGREYCACHVGKNHWESQEPQDKEKVDEHSNTGLLDEDSSSA